MRDVHLSIFETIRRHVAQCVSCTLLLACGPSVPAIAPTLKDHLSVQCPVSKIEVIEKHETPLAVVYNLRVCGKFVEVEERIETHVAPEMTVEQVRSFGDLLSGDGYPSRVISALAPIAKDTCEKREFARTAGPHEDPPTPREIKALETRWHFVQKQCQNAKVRYLGSVKAPPDSTVWFFDAEGAVATAQVVWSSS